MDISKIDYQENLFTKKIDIKSTDFLEIKNKIIKNKIKYKNTGLYEILNPKQNIYIKPYFDIEITDNNEYFKQAIQNKKEFILFPCIEFIIQQFNVYKSDLAISESKYEYKISYHIVIYNKKILFEQLINWSKQNINNLKQLYFDDCVYKRTPFRMIYTSKQDKYSPLLPKTYKNDSDIDKHFITNINQCETIFLNIKNIQPKKYVDNIQINSIELKEILKCFKEFDINNVYQYRNMQNNIINLDRINKNKPTQCYIDNNKYHENDNAYLICNENKSIYFHCRRCATSININNIQKNIIDENIIERTQFNNKNIQELTYTQVQPYNFNNANTLFIKADMGMGKTYQINKLLQNNTYQKVLFITNRRTLAYKISKDCNISHYKEDNFNKNKCVIQLESIFKLDATTSYDIIVLDELRSLLQQLNSVYTLKSNIKYIQDIFKSLLRNCDKCICLDADLNQDCVDIIKELKSDYYIYNYIHAKHENTIQNIYENKVYWLSTLNKYLNKNKQIVIACCSFEKSNEFYKQFSSDYPNKNIKLYNKDTDIDIKKKDLKNVNKAWKEVDILIYTPSISTGISYELDTFDAVFGYFPYNCGVLTNQKRQMLMRCRCVNEFHIFINKCKFNKPTNKSDIEKFIHISKQFRDNDMYNIYIKHLPKYYQKNGNIEFEYKNDWSYKLMIWYLQELFNSENSYIDYINQVKETHSKIIYINKVQIDIDFIKKLEKTTKEIKKEYCKNILKSNNISSSIYNHIQNKIDCEEKITDNEKHQLQRYYINNTYNFTCNLNKKNIEILINPQLMRAYKNICDIYTTKYSFQDIINIMKSHVINNKLYKNKPLKHVICNELIIQLGFKNVFDTGTVVIYEDLTKKIDNWFMNINLKHIIILFEKTSNVNIEHNFKQKLEFINSLFNNMYCINVYKYNRKKNNDNSEYKLKLPNFIFDKDTNTDLNTPKILFNNYYINQQKEIDNNNNDENYDEDLN